MGIQRGHLQKHIESDCSLHNKSGSDIPVLPKTIPSVISYRGSEHTPYYLEDSIFLNLLVLKQQYALDTKSFFWRCTLTL